MRPKANNMTSPIENIVKVIIGGHETNLNAIPIAIEMDKVKLQIAETGLDPLTAWVPRDEWETTPRVELAGIQNHPDNKRHVAKTLVAWLNHTLGALMPELRHALVLELTQQARRQETMACEVVTNECQIQVRGQVLACPAYPDPCSYVRVQDEEGNTVGYWDKDEWQKSPEEIMGAFIGLLNSPVTLSNPLRQVSETEFHLENEDPIWITVVPKVEQANQAAISVSVRRTDDGVSIKVYPIDEEDSRALASCTADFPEAVSNQ